VCVAADNPRGGVDSTEDSTSQGSVSSGTSLNWPTPSSGQPVFIPIALSFCLNMSGHGSVRLRGRRPWISSR